MAVANDHPVAPREDLLHEKPACGTTQTWRNGDWGAERNLRGFAGRSLVLIITDSDFLFLLLGI